MESLSPDVIAALAMGLREDSRVRLEQIGIQYPVNTMLLATIADRIGYMLFGSAEHFTEFIPILLDESQEAPDADAFDSAADFEKERERILKGGG